MRSYTRPLLVTGLGADGETATALEALPLRVGEQGALYDERWLQNLIQRNPHIVPVDQIEPALTPLVPVCMELPTGSGWADNLLMTADGGIVLVEAKLWRNPEARRQVVGQVLDYAKDLASWTYAELQAAVRFARKDPRLNLYDLVCGSEAPPELEAAFVDAVTRNLRLGRVLLVVAGDGIQESAEKLAEFLQRHLGLHFTLAMVEISLWRTPDGAVFVQPKVLTRTVQIERAVVRLEGGVTLTAAQFAPGGAQARPVTLSTETFYEGLERIEAGVAERLGRFLARAEELGIYPDVQRGLSLKWQAADGLSFRLLHMNARGQINTDWAHGDANAIGRIDLSHTYLADLAGALPGGSVRMTATPVGWRVLVDGQLPTVANLVVHPDAWLAAMKTYVGRLSEALQVRHADLPTNTSSQEETQ